MKKIIQCAAVALLFASQSLFATNVGVFDFWKVWQNDPEVTQVRNQLKDHFTPQGKEIMTTRTSLQENIIKLNSKSILDALANTALQNDIITHAKKLEDLQTAFRKDWNESQQKTLNTVLEHIKSAIASVARANNIQLVLSQANVAYSDDTIDLTDAIIKELKSRK